MRTMIQRVTVATTVNAAGSHKTTTQRKMNTNMSMKMTTMMIEIMIGTEAADVMGTEKVGGTKVVDTRRMNMTEKMLQRVKTTGAREGSTGCCLERRSRPSEFDAA